MEDLSNDIQAIRDQINDLEADKKTLLENNLNGEKDIDIAVIENEIMELETKMGRALNQYAELTEYVNYQSSCNHIFIEDLIDIDPDKSKIIKYCVNCLFTEDHK